MQNKFNVGDKVVNQKSCMVFYKGKNGGYIKDSNESSKFVGSVIAGELVVLKLFLALHPEDNVQEYFYTCGDALDEEFKTYLWESEMSHHPFYGSKEVDGGVFNEASKDVVTGDCPPLESYEYFDDIALSLFESMCSDPEDEYLTEGEVEEEFESEEQLTFKFESDVIEGDIEFTLDILSEDEIIPEPEKFEEGEEDPIHALKLHESLRIENKICPMYVTRVPSGWIYNTESGDTFVPDVKN